MSRLLTMAEVSEHLGKPVETLKRWRKTNTGPPSFLVGGSVRYDPADLSAWLDQQRAASLSGEHVIPETSTAGDVAGGPVREVAG